MLTDPRAGRRVGAMVVAACYVDVAIGDADAHATATEHYRRCAEWLSTCGGAYGLPRHLHDLSVEELETAEALYLGTCVHGGSGGGVASRELTRCYV